MWMSIMSILYVDRRYFDIHAATFVIRTKRSGHGVRQGVRRGGTGVLLGVVAAEVDLLLCVPDVRLPAPGAPAQGHDIMLAHASQKHEEQICPAPIVWTYRA